MSAQPHRLYTLLHRTILDLTLVLVLPPTDEFGRRHLKLVVGMQSLALLRCERRRRRHLVRQNIRNKFFTNAFHSLGNLCVAIKSFKIIIDYAKNIFIIVAINHIRQLKYNK